MFYLALLCLCAAFLATKYMDSIYSLLSNTRDTAEAESSLQFVFSTYRHGIRSPGFPSFPTDPYKDRSKFFPDGKGALTKTGKQLMYKVGSVIRKRYSNFLGPSFSDDVHFVSTNIQRTMTSAMLVSCGMFPPEGYQKWSTDINWQPIPVWLDNNESDKTLLWEGSISCPRFKKDATDIKSKTQLPDKTLKPDLYEFISEQTGDKRNSAYDMYGLWDILECQLLSGYTLPEWTKKVYPDKIKDIVAETYNLMVNGTSSILRIFSGPLYYRVYDLLNAKVNGSLVLGRKMYLHAGHDVSVLSFLRGIGYSPLLIVKPGDGVFLELHYLSDIYYVKLSSDWSAIFGQFHWLLLHIGFWVYSLFLGVAVVVHALLCSIFYLSLLTTGEEFQEMAIPGCASPCPLSTFLKLASPLSAQEWDLECST